MSCSSTSDFEQLGGAEGVAQLVEAFLSAVFADPIIGFWFEGRDQSRIRAHELELAIGHLGGPKAYSGRGLSTLHKPLGIHRGHFRRRLAILRTVLLREGAPEPIVARWVAHDAGMERGIVIDADCVPPA